MTFGAPLWLYALAGVLPALVLLFLWSERRMQRRLRDFAASKLAQELTANYSPARQRLKMGLVLLGVSSLLVALARPQYGHVLQESEARGIDLMIALDTSRSMLAEDVKPSRLERAKLAVLDLVDALEGDRVGLIAFAGEAFLQCPLTLDYDAFRSTLAATDTRIIPRGGTDIAAAIAEARAALDDERNFKLLVLITDGEDLEAAGIAAAREAAEAGLRIFTVGVGGAQGEPIPVRDAAGNPTFLRDASGRIVQSALDEDTLRAIAAASSGFYAPLGATGAGLQSVYQQLIAELPAEELGTRVQQIPLERYQWPLSLALLCLFLEPLLGTRRRGARRGGVPSLRRSATLLLTLTLFLTSVPSTPAGASPLRAMERYEEGRYAEAAELLEAAVTDDPDDPRLHYNLGNAYYRLERWDEARRAFEAALRTTDPSLQADAFFNLGNALFQLGQSAPETPEGRAARLNLWEEALRAYENSAALKEQATDVSRNESIVSRAIEAISRRLTTVADPEQAGTAEPDGRYVLGAEIELRAAAHDGWMFRSWTGAPVAEPDRPTTTLVLGDDTVATATFVKTWQLEVVSAQPEHGTAAKSGEYPEDEPVTVTATPVEPWVFDYWEAEGAEVAPTDQAEAQVTLSQDATVTAHFAPGFLLEIETEPALGGWAGPAGYHKQHSEVTISAETREGFSWTGWIGEGIADRTAEQTTVQLDSDLRISAHFQREWNLIVAEDDRQAGSVTGSGDFPVGTETPISATPNEGYAFAGWVGEGVADPAAPETTVTVQSTRHDVIARFRSDESESSSDQDQNEQSQEDQDPSSEPQDQEQEEQESSEDEGEGAEPPPQEDEEEPSEAEPSEPEQEEPATPEEEEGQEAPEPAEEEAAEPEAMPAEAREAGEMTPEEARQLLNALRESEKKLPAVRRVPRGEDTTGRDW